jgi:hypothetical protein
MPQQTDYLEVDVSLLTEDQLWTLRQSLSKGREWLTRYQVKLSRQEEHVASELAKRLEKNPSKPAFEVLKVWNRPPRDKNAAKLKRLDWRQSTEHFLSALKPGMSRATWVEAVREETGIAYSTYQVNITLEILRGRGRGKKKMAQRILPRGAAFGTTYHRKTSKTTKPHIRRPLDWRQAAEDFMSVLKPGMKRSEWVEAVRDATGAEYDKKQIDQILAILKGKGEGTKALKARVVQDGMRSMASYRAESAR